MTTHTSPTKASVKDMSGLRTGIITGLKSLKSTSLQDKLATVIGNTLSSSRSGKHAASAGGDAPQSKMPKLSPEKHKELTVKPSQGDLTMPQLSPQMTQMLPSQLTPEMATQLYYYSQVLLNLF